MNSKVQVKVPKRSGFDKSHKNLLTTKVGTLTPILVDELIPNSNVNLKAAVSACLPPLASDTFMSCDLKLEAFFVPHRLVYGGFEKWLTGEKVYDPNDGIDVDVVLPSIVTGGQVPAPLTAKGVYGPGTLFDYLGGKWIAGSSASTVPAGSQLNPFPILSYYKIWDDWYRNTQVQSPLFYPVVESDYTAFTTLSTLPYITYGSQYGATNYVYGTNCFLAEGQSAGDKPFLGELLQRNFGMDYFTIATPKAQMGDAKSVSFSTTGSTGSFTIASLRAANSLQQFAERNALGGLRMQDYVKNQYGADLSSGVAQRTIYLGSTSFNVYSKGIFQNANGTGTTATQNPFSSSVGAEFGSAKASGEGNLVDNFTANEPGTLMVLASLVPRVTYSTGLDRLMTRYATGSITDMANPMLQNVGNQPIFEYELNCDKYFSASTRDAVFGYTDRYADWKTKNDELHGLMRDGESLESFALQRTVSGSPKINSDFLEIPKDYLDQVSAVAGDISNYGVWIDSYFDYKVAMPLAQYSIPSLQDPAYEHGIDITVDVRGSRL